ncbi:MAG: hypothetical protein R3C10_23610 [Pirellulales bacterium]
MSDGRSQPGGELKVVSRAIVTLVEGAAQRQSSLYRSATAGGAIPAGEVDAQATATM